MVSAAGELDLRGGHPIVDFVNTVTWRGDPARLTDYLSEYSDVVAWCRHRGVLSDAESSIVMRAARSDVTGARRTLLRAKQLRESLHAWFTTAAKSELATITDDYVSAVGRRELRAVDDGVSWAEREITVRSPLDRLAADAVSFITEIPRGGVKQCEDAACGWLFVDASRRQNRRWCSAADCGNRDRARRHYARSRSR
jgi:predicted RNA-binding Zn ribbon-like protein